MKYWVFTPSTVKAVPLPQGWRLLHSKTLHKINKKFASVKSSGANNEFCKSAKCSQVLFRVDNIRPYGASKKYSKTTSVRKCYIGRSRAPPLRVKQRILQKCKTFAGVFSGGYYPPLQSKTKQLQINKKFAGVMSGRANKEFCKNAKRRSVISCAF